MSRFAIDTGPSALPPPGVMQARSVRNEHYLEVTLSGQVGIPDLIELIRRLGTLTREHGDSRLLFDLLHLEGAVHVAGQMQVGEQIGQSLSHLLQIASVVPGERLTRLSESVARSKGVRMKVFDSKAAAVAWLRDSEPGEDTNGTGGLDLARAAIWEAVRHLFPRHSQAIQLPSGTLAISWAIRAESGRGYEMATPITVRLEEELVERLRVCNAEQRQRIAAQHEPSFREGLIGYDPYTAVPRARVIVLG